MRRDDMWSERPVFSAPISLVTDGVWHIQNNRDAEAIVLEGEIEQWLSLRLLHIRRIDDDQFSVSQSNSGEVVQRGEGVDCRIHRVFIVAHYPSKKVGREGLCRQEVFVGEGGFPASGGADENHDAEVGDRNVKGFCCFYRSHFLRHFACHSANSRVRQSA